MITTDRRHFISSLSVGAAALAASPRASASSARQDRSATGKSVANLVVPAMEKVRFGIIGVGRRGSTLLRLLLGVDGTEIPAICDTHPKARANGLAICAEAGADAPETYGATSGDWKNLLARDDVDVVLIATPWSLHAPMAVTSMAAGKHTLVEVPAAMTVDESWQLVEASERHQVNCMMLENVCYGRNEMMALNMVRANVLGELLHGEAAYIHELRWQMKDLESGTGSWRTDWHARRNANLYPTHGLGPVAQYMDINRGDRFDFLNSVSSPALGRRLYANRKLPDSNRHKHLSYICGDMNTSIIKTKRGRSIMLQHDTSTPRPYSRHNLIQGTNGVFAGYPNRIALEDNPLAPDVTDGFHHWDEDMDKWYAAYDHPIWTKLREEGGLSGERAAIAHGGMDFVMLWRIVYCLRNAIRLDQNVYDAAAWSVVSELSGKSVAGRGAAIDFPDFTRGEWETLDPLTIAI